MENSGWHGRKGEGWGTKKTSHKMMAGSGELFHHVHEHACHPGGL